MEAEAVRAGAESIGRLALGKDGIWAARIRRRGGMKVTCRSGCLWITWERGGDRILAAGESVQVDAAGLVVIQGMEDSRFEIRGTGGNGMRWVGGWLDFLARPGLPLRLGKASVRC